MGTGDHQYFCESKWKRKQTNTHKLMGMRAYKQVFQEIEKTPENMRKHYRSKKSFSYEIYAGTSKAAHKVFQQRGASSIREFSVLHNLQFFARKLWLKIGCIFN